MFCLPVALLQDGFYFHLKIYLADKLKFNVELDETDDLLDDTQIWKTCNVTDNRPPVMVIETYIDNEGLDRNQTLVVLDENGRRYNVEDALNRSPSSSVRSRTHGKNSEVVLERWEVMLDDQLQALPDDLNLILPRVYKQSIVLYRSLLTYARLLPAWKFCRKSLRTTPTAPKLKFRIFEADALSRPSRNDTLSCKLFNHQAAATENFDFEPIASPAGPLCIRVTYRYHCDFRIDDSEALLSSQFMGDDEEFFEPSLGKRRGLDFMEERQTTQGAEAGSLPQQRQIVEKPDQSQAYGSLSTFHQVGPTTGLSPLSALRGASEMGRSPLGAQESRPPAPLSAQTSKSSLKSASSAKTGRRPSVSFNPFKAPSLAASPKPIESSALSGRPVSVGKASALGPVIEARAPANMGPPPVPLRASPRTSEGSGSALGPAAQKPPPVARYSSSFGHRKNRSSLGGNSRTEEDTLSSGKASATSSAPRQESGLAAEGGASSGSVHTDDDNISDFLKLIEQKKDLLSSRTTDKVAASNATRRTATALNKFQKYKDTNAALSDSMSSSLLHRSSSSSSRQLANVPPMVAGASISTSSSPGKPISPHTPHTPAIPSRLSAASNVRYADAEESDLREQVGDGTEDEPDTPGGIDIPTSPRPYVPAYRRSSSVANRTRPAPMEEDLGDMYPFVLRPASMGTDDHREPLTMSQLANLAAYREGSAVEDISSGEPGPTYGPAPQPNQEHSEAMRRDPSSSQEGRGLAPSSLPARALSYRPRIGRGSRGHGSPYGSQSSIPERASNSGSSDQRGGRYSFSRPPHNFDEGEPLLFAMSDFNAAEQSRRSLEGRPGGESGRSSRRGSRMGG